MWVLSTQPRISFRETFLYKINNLVDVSSIDNSYYVNEHDTIYQDIADEVTAMANDEKTSQVSIYKNNKLEKKYDKEKRYRMLYSAILRLSNDADLVLKENESESFHHHLEIIPFQYKGMIVFIIFIIAIVLLIIN
jgi:hypothetical protein